MLFAEEPELSFFLRKSYYGTVYLMKPSKILLKLVSETLS